MARIGPPAFRRRDLPPDIGRRVLDARIRAGLSRTELADGVGVHYRTLARVERGTQVPGVTTLRGIARACREDIGRLAPAWEDDQEELEASGLGSPGPAVRARRLELGLTLGQVARASGVSVSTLSRFERGLHAPRRITAVGSFANGADGINDLAIVSLELARVLGYSSTAALTSACSAFRDRSWSG